MEQNKEKEHEERQDEKRHGWRRKKRSRKSRRRRRRMRLTVKCLLSPKPPAGNLGRTGVHGRAVGLEKRWQRLLQLWKQFPKKSEKQILRFLLLGGVGPHAVLFNAPGAQLGRIRRPAEAI